MRVEDRGRAQDSTDGQMELRGRGGRGQRTSVCIIHKLQNHGSLTFNINTHLNNHPFSGSMLSRSSWMFCLRVCLYTLCMCGGDQGRGFRFPGYCEQTHGCWELNLGPPESQPMPLTSEPTLQPHKLVFFNTGSHLCRPGYPQAQLADTGLSLPRECWDYKLVFDHSRHRDLPWASPNLYREFLRKTEFQRGGRENRIQVLFPLWGVEARALLFMK